MTHHIRSVSPFVCALVAVVLVFVLCYAWGGWEVDRSLSRLDMSLPVAAKVHARPAMQG
jgi:hypothetical protein